MAERKYFEINESMAKGAHSMISMSDYQIGRRTNEYLSYVNKAYELAERIEHEKPKQAEKAWKIATAYAKRMANNMNASSRIGMMCPSILISGVGNFPVKKKEKQNAAFERNYKEFNEIQSYISKLESILYGKEVIRSDDEDAIILLEEKLSKLESEQEFMKEVNAYYRKNKTLNGCKELTLEQIENLTVEMSKYYHMENKPFATYLLTNNNANIHRVRERLEQLKKDKSKENSEMIFEDLNIRVKENIEDMRLQIFFDGKPEAGVREVLKKNGFKWSPKNTAWQRQLTNNARYAMKQVIQKLREM